MNVCFLDKDLENLFINGNVGKGRYKVLSRNKKLVSGFQRAVNIMYSVDSTSELTTFSFLHYEKLKHTNCSSVRIVNGAIERLLFHETENGLEVELIEIDSSHYGNK